jgi:hypothetical protein
MQKRQKRNINIYCLINPINHAVFYVGATVKQLPLRLNEHIYSSKKNYGNGLRMRRSLLIKSIIESGYKVEISLIERVVLSKAKNREKYYYDKFTSEGAELIQSIHCLRYEYSLVSNETSSNKLKITQKYPWPKMDIGDSFRLNEWHKRTGVYGSLRQYNKKRSEGKISITVRAEGDGIRVWRIK